MVREAFANHLSGSIKGKLFTSGLGYSWGINYSWLDPKRLSRFKFRMFNFTLRFCYNLHYSLGLFYLLLGTQFSAYCSHLTTLDGHHEAYSLPPFLLLNLPTSWKGKKNLRFYSDGKVPSVMAWMDNPGSNPMYQMQNARWQWNQKLLSGGPNW